jgi:16S rRNA processing protein RimM
MVEPSSDVPGRFAPGSELEAVSADGRRRSVRVVSSRPHGDGFLVRLEGFDSRDAAESLRGTVFEIERSATPAAPDGSFYYFELIGCLCVDREAGELGTVQEVVEDGGGLLLEVEGSGRSVPVPFVESFIVAVDVDRRRIELDLPAGLLETCAST